MLKDSTIHALTNDMAYRKGCRYFKDGRVTKLLRRPGTSIYVAFVVGSEEYEVRARLDKSGESVEAYDCTCPAAALYTGACKHVVALLKEIQTKQGEIGSDLSRDMPTGRLFECFARAQRRAHLQEQKNLPPAALREAPLFLEPRFFFERHYGRATCWLEFRIGRERLYIVRSVQELLRAFLAGRSIEFGKKLTVDPQTAVFAPGVSTELWRFLLNIWKDEESSLVYSEHFRSFGAGAGRLFDGKSLKLTPSTLTRFFALMKDTPFIATVGMKVERTVHVQEGAPAISLDFMERGGSGRLMLLTDDLYRLDEDARFLLANDTIYHAPSAFSAALHPLLEAFGASRSLTVAEKDVPAFFGTILPALEKIADVHIAPALAKRYEIMPLTASIYLDYYKDGVAARPEFRYDEVRFNPLVGAAPQEAPSGRRLIRSTAEENAIYALFDAYDFFPEDGRFVQSDEEKSFLFLDEALPELSKIADVYYADAFHEKPVRRMPPVTIGVSVNDENLLDVTFDAAQLDFTELIGVLRAYREKRIYHRLKDGSFVTLGDQQLAGLADFIESIGVKKATDAKNIELPLRQALYLDALAKEEKGIRLERSKRFKSIVRDVKNPVDADIEPPETLKGVLRDYQQTGFSWLSTLAAYHLGGILADDMGLGKTLQVIAFLLAHREDEKPPALVVAPTSLLYNWLEEIEKFAPALKAAIVAGTKSEREAALCPALKDADVIITTYHMLRRDIELYEKERFSHIFLDEAQQIKNPATQAAKAVKRLKADAAFALTGTPIENSLTELWSIFDFLMPGYLRSRKHFQSQFETPIIRAKDPHASADLLRYISPFILRRLKKDVLEELPDKVERKMTNEMTDEQRKVYKAWFVQAKKEFAAELKAHGFGEMRIKILAILTRLRQIACDPALFLENYDGGSGKLDMLEEVVSDAVAAGHRILVFSQFTTMLARIAERLDAMNLGYAYLDGSTPALERVRLVRDFNAGAEPIFLISLKAGGTGLNLTGADMVIHYDPWWNPAVEDQATDRAYRIGQKNNVQVLKFITKDTIEEKIYELQEKKKALIDQMIQPGENFLTKLSEEEITALFQ
ncbi:DEAD/DEAH box helicase [Selenomonas sp.]|uniref:DEAD/DEAH box helicase n=1 Tax=Selenomonas sp. TaxID=2053611 RepID=UPI003FA30015